jgi:SAM-dependent methyltransferase
MDIVEVSPDNTNRHPWEISRSRCLLRLLGPRDAETQYIDVGAGDLHFARGLGALSRRPVIAVDPGFREADLGLADGIRRFRDVAAVPPGTGDCVVAMDVLEHVPDDAALLAAVAALAKPGGDLLITVPAFQFLYSGHDAFLRHERRYDRRGLAALLQACALRPVELFYFYSSLFVARLFEMGARALAPADARGAGRWRFAAAHPTTRAITALLDADFFVGRQASRFGMAVPGLSLCAHCKTPSA